MVVVIRQAEACPVVSSDLEALHNRPVNLPESLDFGGEMGKDMEEKGDRIMFSKILGEIGVFLFLLVLFTLTALGLVMILLDFVSSWPHLN